MLERDPAPVPTDLAARAVAAGARRSRRRHALRAVLWVLLCVAVVVFAVWALSVEPWVARPDRTSPSYGW